MQEITASGRYPLSPGDFTTDQDTGLQAISLSSDMDCSFSVDGVLVFPDMSRDDGNGSTVFLFSRAPDILYVHAPLQGEDGRALPVQQMLVMDSMLNVPYDLKRDDATPLPPREQPQDQEADLPESTDPSFIMMMVAGKTAWTASSQPSLSMKLPKNNRELSFVDAVFRTAERKENDQAAWKPPTHVEAFIWKGSPSFNANGNEIVAGFGCRLEQAGWLDEGTTKEHVYNPVTGKWTWSSQYKKGFGYQYARATSGDGEMLVYRNEDWDSATEYTLRAEVWSLNSVFTENIDLFEEHPDMNIAYYFRTRYANGTDSGGRVRWRGWSPVIGFKMNLPPSPPSDIRLHIPQQEAQQ